MSGFLFGGLHGQNLEPVTKGHRNTIEFKTIHLKPLEGLNILEIKYIGVNIGN